MNWENNTVKTWNKQSNYCEIDILTIAGDMNAKTGNKAYEEYPSVVGRYTKSSKMNKYGRDLVECLFRSNITQTNTIFKHKVAHRHRTIQRTIWQGPEKNKWTKRCEWRQTKKLLSKTNRLCNDQEKCKNIYVILYIISASQDHTAVSKQD